MKELRFERLLGTVVRDGRGKTVGRLEEAVVERRGDEWLVVEFHAGTWALAERLAAPLFGFSGGRGVRIPWDRLDLTDPARPVVRGDADDLVRYRRTRRP